LRHVRPLEVMQGRREMVVSLGPAGVEAVELDEVDEEAPGAGMGPAC